eukprot:1160887-Pelagomonas_calceolata.AAC.3
MMLANMYAFGIKSLPIHFTETKYCKDTRPGAQLKASQQQHSGLCKQLEGAETALHTVLLGVGGTIYTAHTLDQFKKLGIDTLRSSKNFMPTLCKFEHRLNSPRRAIENKNNHYNSGALGPRAARNPPDPY